MRWYIGTIKLVIGITGISVIILSSLSILKFVPKETFIISAQLGDTMNIVAPFINIGATILILHSFREQKRSNDIQTRQYNFDRIGKLILELRDLREKLIIELQIEDLGITNKTGHKAIGLLYEYLNRESKHESIDSIVQINTTYINILKLLKVIAMIGKSIESNELDIDSKEYLAFKLMEELRIYLQELEAITRLDNLKKPYHILIRDSINRSLVYIRPLYKKYDFNDIV